MSLRNCTKCGVMFINSASKLCPDCAKTRSSELDILDDWLKSPGKRLLSNLEKETGISAKTFTDYVLQGKIRAFSHVWAECDICGHLTFFKAKQVVCEKCCIQLKKRVGAIKKGSLDGAALWTRKAQ